MLSRLHHVVRVPLDIIINFSRNLLSWHSQISLTGFFRFISWAYAHHLGRIKRLFRCFIFKFISLLDNRHWASESDPLCRWHVFAKYLRRSLLVLLVWMLSWTVFCRMSLWSLLRWGTTYAVLIFIEVIFAFNDLMLFDCLFWIQDRLRLFDADSFLTIRIWGLLGATVFFRVNRIGERDSFALAIVLIGRHFNTRRLLNLWYRLLFHALVFWMRLFF